MLGDLKLVSAEGDTNKSELMLVKERGNCLGPHVLRYDNLPPSSSTGRVLIRGILF